MRRVCSFILSSAWAALPLVAVGSTGTAVIDIDEDQTILAYYKAGLHPVHAPGSAFSTLEFTESRVSIKIGGHVYGPLDAKRASLRMRNDTDPTNVSIRSTPMKVEDARRLLYKWTETFPMSPQDVDRALEKILDPNALRIAAEFGSLQIGSSERPGRNFRLGIGVMRTFLEPTDESEDPVGIQIGIGVSYPSRSPSESQLQPAGQPLRPPPGFEHLPMERELAAAMWEHEGQQAQPTEVRTADTLDNAGAYQERQAVEPRNVSESAENPEAKPFVGTFGLWLLGSAAALAVLGWFAVRMRAQRGR